MCITSPTAGRQATAGRPSASHPGGAVLRRTVLPGGLRIVSEQVPGVRSVAVGVWVGVGSRDESAATHGASHFLEHLLFKGTAQRTALDISVALDEVGGELNAFTGKEYTCFHARVLDDDLPLAVDVLGDMITGSVLADADVEAERDVILDEIAMHDDDPDDVVHELFAEQAWGSGTPLGRSIDGTHAAIDGLPADEVRRFYRRHYRAATTVVALAGNLDHDRAVELVRAAFDRGGFLDGDELPVAPRIAETDLAVHPGRLSATRPFEQVNLVLGMQGLTLHDDRRYALGVLNTALGGGTSSRLFQEVRERRGLAYSVFSFATHHADSGLVGVSVGCLPGRVDDVLTVIRAELAGVAAGGITADELRRGQGTLRGGMVLGLEDTASRMSRIGRAELVHDRVLTIDEVLDRVEAVTLEETAELAADLFTRPELLAVVGP